MASKARKTTVIKVRKVPVMVDMTVRDQFISALRECGVVEAAATRSGVSRRALYRARDKHPVFAAAWAEALAWTPEPLPVPAIDPALLEAAVFNRLMLGVGRRKLYAGKITDRYREFEDRLALMMLAKLWPEKYGANSGATDPGEPLAMTRDEVMARLDVIRNRSHLKPTEHLPG